MSGQRQRIKVIPASYEAPIRRKSGVPTRRHLTSRRRVVDRRLAAASLPADAAPLATASRCSVVSCAQISSLCLLVASAGLGVAAAYWGLGSPSLARAWGQRRSPRLGVVIAHRGLGSPSATTSSTAQSPRADPLHRVRARMEP
ncbi:hypothetical protein GUJ93_ZPchr0015g6761 [Zizania palustris]|uniref:Uncharacterized protein n=1 Tax=Zizania palustris TaxID=103762 RepID=A0A8J5TLR4_ZIZPA|nr:hypothetical protein GUJ93_ZPchr0015g6761 [Zizania palustris]